MQQVASTSVYFGRRTIVWLSNTPLGRVYTPSRVISTEARSNFRRRLATEEDDYQEAINVLNQYQTRLTRPKIKLSPRDLTTGWLSQLGCDVKDLSKSKVIHVAGSKGKGTTCLYCNRLLNYYRTTTGKPENVMCYTSPHQTDVRDRFLINNERIPKWLFAYYVQELHSKIRSLPLQPGLEYLYPPLYPGFLALLAIYVFIWEKIDVLVLETGIGGETDSTNVFPHPIATGITSIGLDHVQVLGNTVEEIAWHKAGIFKQGSPAFAVIQHDAVLKVLRRRAQEKGTSDGLQVVTDSRILEYGIKLRPDMQYQRQNAALAIELVESYLRSENTPISITNEVATTLQDTELLGRSQVVVEKDNTWFISVAHSDISLKETISWFKGVVQQSGHHSATRVLVFNQSPSKQSPRDPHLLLEVIHTCLCVDTPLSLQGVIFCTSQLDEKGKTDLMDFRINHASASSLKQQEDNGTIWKILGGTGNIHVINTIKEASVLIREKYHGAEVLVTGCPRLASGMLHLLKSTR